MYGIVDSGGHSTHGTHGITYLFFFGLQFGYYFWSYLPTLLCSIPGGIPLLSLCLCVFQYQLMYEVVSRDSISGEPCC